MGLFSAIAGIFGGNSQKKAADKAAKLQFEAAQQGIAESARQFDQTRSDFAPYQEAGTAAIGNLSDLIGLNGDGAQQGEIDALRNSPLYQSLYNNGRDALLSTASATGGLRGGNTQDALSRFGGDTLSQVIAQQLGNYGGLVGIGTGSAGAVGNFGANAVFQQNQLRGQGAEAKAQAALTKAGINAQNFQNFGSVADSAISSFLPAGSSFSKFF